MAQRSGRLEVDGASIYFEDYGDACKPVLLLVAPGNGTCLYFKPLIRDLLPEFRVVTFDRRGFHRSYLSNKPGAESILRENADDCVAIISHLSLSHPVAVFTSSGNTTVGLELLRHHPEMISKLLLHEPVILSLLPSHDQTKSRHMVDEVCKAFLNPGSAAANRILMPHVSSKSDIALLKQAPILRDLAALPSDSSNLYFSTELPALTRYEVDVVSLVAGADKVILAHGQSSAPPLSHYPVRMLGGLLGKTLLEFPGGHNGYVTHPEDFANRLIHVLQHGRQKL